MQTPLKSRDLTRAWTLIATIGVLAVIAILSAVLFPALLRQIDQAVADQETANLRSFADAFQQYVLTSRVIPDQTTWYSAVASKLGFGANDVLYNPRQQSHQQSRVFLVEQMTAPGSYALPYTQTTNVGGAVSPALFPRLMIVSSLGRALPTLVSNGVFNANYFADLWNARDSTLPSDAAWTNWNGNPADVLVQRINLTPLFVHLLLGRYNSSVDGYYTVDGVDGTTGPTLVTNVDGYFLQGTVLTLYKNGAVTGMDTKQILTTDTSFVFEQGIWRGNITGASAGNGAANVGDLVQQFLEATPNTNTAPNWSLSNQNTQQVLVVKDMLNFMSNYNVWAYQYSFTNTAFNDTKKNSGLLIDLQKALMLDIQGLYLLSGNVNQNHYPGNTNTPCR